MEENNLKELTGKEILNELCGKELNSKNNILEAIEKIKPLAKEGLESDKIQEIYNVIYKSIEEMNTIVKANTIMYLKNQLKSALGKFVENKDPKEMNYFLEFFKEAYPPNNRRVGYTRVINDFSKITNEQIWETLTFINRAVIKTKRRLGEDEKQDIINNINNLLASGKIEYINQVKSLEKLLNVLNVKVVNYKEGFKLKNR
ncbi:hypothetical protein [Clostridium disporicum]|uniref:hypothetical protein n=1 Tax=Clostridium disporicum TaxID=84024 RepID=UPI0006C0BBE8|nr:hypothetical protein [Clostridium disporicum]CUN93510.1 Uncharacterised protein [Clostridium disporicum]